MANIRYLNLHKTIAEKLAIMQEKETIIIKKRKAISCKEKHREAMRIRQIALHQAEKAGFTIEVITRSGDVYINMVKL